MGWRARESAGDARPRRRPRLLRERYAAGAGPREGGAHPPRVRRVPMGPHLRENARVRRRARRPKRWGCRSPFPRLLAGRTKGAGGSGASHRGPPAAAGPGRGRAPPWPAARARRGARPPPLQAPPPRCERSRSAAAHADPCPPPPPPQAALAAAPGPAEAGMLEKLEFQEEGECATRALRCRRRAPGLQPTPGKHRAPGMQPGSWGRSPALRKAPGLGEAAEFLGMQPCSGVAPGSGDGALFPGTQPCSRDAVRFSGNQSGSRGCSSAPRDAAGFWGTQPRSRERPPARSKGRPFCPPHPNSRECQVSCSPNCACHRAPRGHPRNHMDSPYLQITNRFPYLYLWKYLQ